MRKKKNILTFAQFFVYMSRQPELKLGDQLQEFATIKKSYKSQISKNFPKKKQKDVLTKF